MNVLSTAVSYDMHDTPYRLLVLTYVLVVIILRSIYVPGMVFGIWNHTAVVECKYGLLAIWHATRMYSFLFVLEVRGPSKNPD